MYDSIKKPADPKNMTELEQKHTPVIEAPDTVNAGEPFNITVTIGSKLHVMEQGHYIQYIDIYVDFIPIARVDLTPVTSRPKATVTAVLAKDGAFNLRAFELCNLHGFWEWAKPIQVKAAQPAAV